MKALTATVIAIALILVPMSQAYASDVEIIDIPHVWVFVVDRACTVDTEILRADILSIETYAPYIGSLDVVCFPNAPMLEIGPVVQVLKQTFPGDAFKVKCVDSCAMIIGLLTEIA